MRRHALALTAILVTACGGGGGGGDTGTGATPSPLPGGAAVTRTALDETFGPAPAVAPPTSTEGGGSASFVSRSAGCTLAYTLTAAPALAAGPDPLLSQQWHLSNTGQTGGTPGIDLRLAGASGAWTLAPGRGAGVRVAVIDDALEVLHPDLRPNVVELASHDYRDGDAWPLPCTASDDRHGTAVGGIVAARDGNALGVAGVAPRALLVGYNALATGSSADTSDAMTRGLAANAIYQNSWGNPDDGGPNEVGTLWENAVERGLAQGRGGRGAVYVFSGGNGGNSAPLIRGTDDANLDGYVNKRGVIAVCAMDQDGRAPSYAEPGSNILVCGTGGDGATAIATTDILSGYRPVTDSFTGTSAAAPTVAGVVAQMLAVNPNLSWRDVRLILAQTARETPAAAADPAAGWQASALTPGKRVSRLYGFGLADAAAAVRAAAGWASVGGRDALIACDSGMAEWQAAIPDDAATGVASAVALPGCGIRRVEWVEVTFSSDHPYSADLDIRLRSPSGSESQLVAQRRCFNSLGTTAADNPCRRPYDAWRFGSVRFMGEPAAGGWALTVSDRDPGETGRALRWRLRVFGS